MDELQTLVTQAQAGDKTAYGELYERCCPRIFNYVAYQLPGQPDLAEELTERVFAVGFQRLAAAELGTAPFLSRLYRIAREQLAARALKESDRLLPAAGPGAARTGLDRVALAGALQQIPPLEREAVLLRVVNGHSLAEAAATLGQTERAVARLQRTGLEALQAALRGAGPSPGGESERQARLTS